MVARLYQYRFGKREGLILQKNGGWGEIAPLPGFSRETLDEAREELLAILFSGAKATLPSVRFGLACASTPFSLEPLCVPLCALHRPRPGCAALKLKLGHLPIDDAIALVKSHLGKYLLRLDCNRAWSLEQALRFAQPFTPGDFDYLEEPVREFDDLLRFSSHTRFPIAVDESLRDSDYQKIATLKAAIVKPTLIGEIPNLPIPIVLSSSYETSLGILQIARHAPSSLPQGLDTFEDDLLIPPLRVENGFLAWSPSPNPIDTAKLCLIATAP